MYKYTILYLLVLVAGWDLVSSCHISLVYPVPLFTKSLGSKKIVFKPQGNFIQISIGESITAYCNTEIEYNGNSYDRLRNYEYGGDDNLPTNVLKIMCNSNNKIVLNNQRTANVEQIRVSCKSSTTYDLYESKKKKLPNCIKYMSYAIGAPLHNIEDKIIAALCYDIDKFELKYASYVSYRDAAIFSEQKYSNELSVNLDELVGGLENYYPFMSQHKFNISRDNSQNALLNAFNFDLMSLMQDKTLENEITEFNYIFTTMWWRQLRQQNWHYFLQALHDRSQSVKYLVYTGTYGNATIPTEGRNCSTIKNYMVSVTTEDTTVNAPAYIWAYLKPINSTEQEKDVVVIAHNSPYVVNPGHSEFCSVDVCDEVDWLKNSTFGNLRRLPTLGYTFCCRPEEVAKIIDYFPISRVETATQRPNYSTSVKNGKDKDQ
ncbi:uncharacterized protein [Eurosta solidaginis]|uniref:uncharacterized protein isoform X2 n=1 Tax=Eurosta solidaginis TaxID=178769 RepID=UPI0035317160